MGGLKIALHCTTQNLSELDFVLSGSLKVKCDDGIRHLICGFLLMFNSNIGPNSAHLKDLRPLSVRDTDFELSRSQLDSPYMVSY